MYYDIQPRAKRTLADYHIEELVEVMGELIAVPELRCTEPEELFASTLEVIAKASVIRSAVLDELAPPEDAP